jgi:ABC-2 type transport system ATP-binding protein
VHTVIRDLYFGYGTHDVIRGVNWHIRPGVTGVLGRPGAGKTTLINLVAGLSAPRRGTITWNQTVDAEGLGSTDGTETCTIGLLPQRFSLAGEMIVLDTVSYAAWLHGLTRAECLSAADATLRTVGLLDYRSARVRSLSAVQRRCVGLAAVLAHQPDLVVLDEPMADLDAGQQSFLHKVIAEIGESRSVLVSTNRRQDVLSLCRQVGVLAEGRMIFDGTTEELPGDIVDRGTDIGAPRTGPRIPPKLFGSPFREWT